MGGAVAVVIIIELIFTVLNFFVYCFGFVHAMKVITKQTLTAINLIDKREDKVSLMKLYTDTLRKL